MDLSVECYFCEMWILLNCNIFNFKECLILVLLSSIKKMQRICVTILETKCKYLHKNKQTVYIYCERIIIIYLFRDVSFLFNVFFFVFY